MSAPLTLTQARRDPQSLCWLQHAGTLASTVPAHHSAVPRELPGPGRAGRALTDGMFHTQSLMCPRCLCKGNTFVPISCPHRKLENIFTPRWLEELFSPALHHCAALVSLTQQHLTRS